MERIVPAHDRPKDKEIKKEREKYDRYKNISDCCVIVKPRLVDRTTRVLGMVKIIPVRVRNDRQRPRDGDASNRENP